jgi:hypothetical protein
VLRFLADHNFNFDVVRGLRRRGAVEGLAIDVVTAREVGLAATDDPRILEWAAAEGRIVLSSDVNTLVGFAWDRVRAGAAMPGVFAAIQDAPVGQLIEDLLLLAECTEPDEWSDRVMYLPLK